MWVRQPPPMRSFIVAVLLASLCWPPGIARAVAASAKPSLAPPVDLSAQSVALYADRGLVEARGGVAVRVGAATITASRASIDLRTERLVARNGVHLQVGGHSYAALAYTLDPLHNRAYLLLATHPQRVTRIRGTRLVPQRAALDPKLFLVADVSGGQPLVTAQRVVMRAGKTLAFTAAQVLSGGGYQPSASYTYALRPPNARDFGPSPVVGAALEYPLRIRQSARWYAFGTLRYDRYLGGPGAGMEAHLADSNRGYLVMAATQDSVGARYDALAFERFNPRLNETLSFSRFLGSVYVRYALNAYGKSGFATLSSAQSGGTRSDDLALYSNLHRVGRFLTYQFNGDLGHDVHPGDYAVAQDLRSTLGISLQTAALRVRGFTVSGAYSTGYTFYGYGRERVSNLTSLFLTDPVNPRLLLSGSMSFGQNVDRIANNASAYYPPKPPYTTGNGSIYSGLSAYLGSATLRTYSLNATFQPTHFVGIFSSLTYARDFPQYSGYGRPLFFQTLALRLLRGEGPGIEINSSFGYGGLGQAPRPTLGFSVIR